MKNNMSPIRNNLALRNLFLTAMGFIILLSGANMSSVAFAGKKDSTAIQHDFLPPQDLFVAKITVTNDKPTQLDVIYYHDAQVTAGSHSLRSLSLRSDGQAITFPGNNFLTVINSASSKASVQQESTYVMTVSKKGETGFDLVITRADKVIAKGLGIFDPDDPQSMLISGWTGVVEPYGVVKYSIHDDQTIKGYYLSKMSPDHPGVDTATGNTENGFPGVYSLVSEEKSGRIWGPQEWELNRRGDVIDLVWREHGGVICRGFGIVDSQDPHSIIVNYIPVKK